ncbi:MAG: hypothetical protein WAP51_04430, partial [Candidatus Sungiibacteriota bacterium]
MKIVRAWDESGHEWLIDFETRRAFPAIAGGDDSPVPPETCQRHRGCRLQSLFDNELREKFNVLQI